MHSFKANNDLFISAPSNLVYLFWSVTSAALSLPAKSIKDILPYYLELFPSFNTIYNIAWERDESKLAPVELVTLSLIPKPISCINVWTLLILFS